MKLNLKLQIPLGWNCKKKSMIIKDNKIANKPNLIKAIKRKKFNFKNKN